MLQLNIPPMELYDNKKEVFITTKEKVIQLEHSLVSISKWESKWEKPFLSREKKHEKTNEEALDYIRCMTISPNVSIETYSMLSVEMINQIDKYIDSKMSATIINKPQKGQTNREIVTSELIYYWMIAYQIPFECQKWHINRLLTLIDVCNIKNAPAKNKMSKKEIANKNRTLNEARRKQLNTGG